MVALGEDVVSGQEASAFEWVETTCRRVEAEVGVARECLDDADRKRAEALRLAHSEPVVTSWSASRCSCGERPGWRTRPNGGVWMVTSVSLHCYSCHESDHSSCVICGTCMTAGRRILGEYAYYHWHRADRLYCSGACRQKAYRQRVRAS